MHILFDCYQYSFKALSKWRGCPPSGGTSEGTRWKPKLLLNSAPQECERYRALVSGSLGSIIFSEEDISKAELGSWTGSILFSITDYLGIAIGSDTAEILKVTCMKIYIYHINT